MAATSIEDTISLLARVPTFEALGPDELTHVAEVAVPRSFEPGQVVFREGDASDTCYVVAHGHARAIREHADGRTITLANFGPGDIFGELAMFEDERRSATVEALDAVEAVAILGADMRRLMREHPEIAVGSSSRSAAACARPTSAIARQSFQTVQSRVATVLDAARRGGAGGGRRRARRARRPPRRPTSRSWPAPRASRPAASSPCSSAPG